MTQLIVLEVDFFECKVVQTFKADVAGLLGGRRRAALIRNSLHGLFLGNRLGVDQGRD